MPASRLARRHEEWREDRESVLGKLRGYDVLETALQEGRDVTVVRFRFERGTADRAYVWDPAADLRLQGISFRGLRTGLPFVPTGPGQFAS